MGNSYCKKDYNKVEVNVAKITKIRLQKLKEHVASCCLVRKIRKKKIFFVVVRKEQKRVIYFVS